MIIKFSEDMKKEFIYANGDELAQVLAQDKDESGKRLFKRDKSEKKLIATFDNPVLVTDNYRISKLKPSTLRDTVFRLFEFPSKITEYDGTAIDFEQKKYPGLWGPSIDTILGCYAIKGIDLSKVKDMVEIGPGSGYWTKYVLDHNPQVSIADTVDINPLSKKFIEENIADKRLRPYVGDGIEFIQGKKYDLIMCNPPYIPRPKSIDDNSYEGISLLRYLITDGIKHLNEGGRIITNISSLCQDMIYEAVEESGVKVRVRAEMEVPLKVFNVLNNREWMDYLENRGLKRYYNDIVDKINDKIDGYQDHSGYDYWHTIRIVEITKN